ncbi:MAG: site-specific integrase [Deltaproteobacteria bacterium]|nr:site-specific integrase [Deltaproteobacteria bacterium]
MTAVGVHQRGKTDSIKDLLVKIARREHLEISEGDSTPFSVYASAWLEKKKATIAKSTYGDYRSIWNKYVLPHFGNAPLCRVTSRDVEEFLGSLPDISAKRKNNIMVPLKCLFNDASRRGEIDESPSGNIRRLKEIKPFIDPFSFREMNLLLERVDPRYEAYFTTAFLTGMRPNEMIALKWHTVDFEMRCITVRLEASPGTTYVFPGKTGRPLEVNNLRKRVWYPAIAAAGLRRRTMYQTRHTFASLMLGHGEDPLWVARMLGHTSLDMIFKHYGKFVRNRSRKDGGRFLEGLKEAGKPAIGKDGSDSGRL